MRVFEAAAPPKRLIMVPGAPHFFDGRLDALREAAAQVMEVMSDE